MSNHIFMPCSIIDEYLQTPDESERRKREPHRYWPSQASIAIQSQYGGEQIIGKCHRAMYYNLTDVPETNPIDARGRRILSIGKMIEQQEIEWAESADIHMSHNVKFEHTIDHMTISGEVDAFYKDPKTNETIGIEYKTGYGYLFHAQVFGNTRRKGFPKAEHLLQVMLYLDHYTDVPYFIIIYIDRGDMTKMEHVVSLSKGDSPEDRFAIINGLASRKYTMNQIYTRYRRLDNHVSNNILPPRDFELAYSKTKTEAMWLNKDLSKKKYEDFKKKNIYPGDWQCRYCPYLHVCWEKEQS